MYNANKIINDTLKDSKIKVLVYFVAAYFIYLAGKAAGEFVYYITH